MISMEKSKQTGIWLKLIFVHQKPEDSAEHDIFSQGGFYREREDTSR